MTLKDFIGEFSCDTRFLIVEDSTNQALFCNISNTDPLYEDIIEEGFKDYIITMVQVGYDKFYDKSYVSIHVSKKEEN